ncbi:unnamed protein product [Rangifer tarandus platyrhynchus]|uniref:Uncharacterized protein n=2 Tax=Rangifer tarandus platyrhynchus TaxID=3082113 RepID=A0ACB0FDY7_RANTA|nr:unnamed protein product [Rangifer tarandus platyrhynchus]CAI9711210.1 unnamed protein product [Rangifer tarandus platyrhynchus]
MDVRKRPRGAGGALRVPIFSVRPRPGSTPAMFLLLPPLLLSHIRAQASRPHSGFRLSTAEGPARDLWGRHQRRRTVALGQDSSTRRAGSRAWEA